MASLSLHLMLIFYIAATKSNAQQAFCSNTELEQFVELEKNATIEAKKEILSVVLGVGIGGGNAVEGNQSAVDDTTLYSTIASSLNITDQSDGQRDNFTEALNVITDSYFKSCYGPVEERPSPSDAPQLIAELLTLLINETRYTRVRELYGQLLCLQEFGNNATSGSISKRQIDSTCFNVQNIRSLYDCIDPTHISCIFQFYCPEDSASGQSSVVTRNCLAFVVDTTGSMGEEIAATRQVIADFITGEENIHTACYILVPFNDYEFNDPSDLENNLEFARVYSADSLDDGNDFIKVNDGQHVFGLTRLLNDVNGLTAHGGGDCPEYGMIGIQKAADLLKRITIVGDQAQQKFNLRKHNIIVLTDASAKDNYLAESIIQDLKQSLPDTRVHFFYSGNGCGADGFGNYSSISSSTKRKGIEVKQIDASAFEQFVEFIKNAPAKRRRRSTTCHSFVVSQFISEFTFLAQTNQNAVIVIAPDETSTSLNTADKNFVVHSVSAPMAGEWQVCVTAPGTIDISLTTTVGLDFSVNYLAEDSNGQLLPSSNLPFTCSRKAFTIEIGQLESVSLNHSLFLDFVDEDGNILSSAEITKCHGILSGTMNISSQSVVQYQLRGHDTLGNEFAHVRPNSNFLTLKNPATGLSVSSSDIIINPNEVSIVRLLIKNVLTQPYYNVDYQVYVPSEVNVTTSEMTKFDVLQPQETKSIEISLTSNTLSEGSSFSIILSLNDYCIVTNVTLPASVRPFVNVTLANKTVDSLTFTWVQPHNSISKYIISYEILSTTGITSVVLDNSTLMYTIDNLNPYKLVYFSVIAKNTDDLTVAGSVSQPFRTMESIPSSVERLQIDVTSSTSVKLSWFEPVDKNGVLLHYEIVATSLDSDDSYYKTFTFNVTSSNSELILNDLSQFTRYIVEVRATNSAGKSEPVIMQFYTTEGVPSNGPSTIQLSVVSNNLVQIQWDPPLTHHRRGFIIGYVIELLKYSDETITESIETFTVSENTFFYSFPMLDPYERYEVSIRGKTSAGLGQRNSTVFYTKQGAPLASSKSVNYTIISSTSFLLTWEPPAFNQRRGYLTHYIATIATEESMQQRNARPSTSEKYQISNDITELMITDLDRFGTYSVSVSAATSAGEGPPTNIRVNIVTGVPSAPTNASGEQINSTAVVLEWGYPEEENGRIEEFFVSYSYEIVTENGTYSNRIVLQLPAPSNKSVITNLTSGKRYKFEIAARNPAGVGDATAIYISLMSADEVSVTGRNSGAIAASVSVVLVIIIIISVSVVVATIAFLVFRKKQKILKPKDDIPLPD